MKILYDTDDGAFFYASIEQLDVATDRFLRCFPVVAFYGCFVDDESMVFIGAIGG